MNKTIKDLLKMQEELNQSIRNFYSRNLIDTSSNNPLNVSITLTIPDTFGLSSNDMLRIEKIWQHPTEGYIDMKIYGSETILSFEQFSNEELLYIAEELWQNN